ncbi:MAG: DUF1549 domain-containing protein, partial [Planctomycetota bacterium]|nr:DUF1549 domain-containing protein [Planctomycetota bacterium]
MNPHTAPSLRLAVSVAWFTSLALVATCGGVHAAEPADADFFEAKIRPILIDRCLSCHGSEKQKGGLRLDSAAAVNKGGDAGLVIDRDQPAKSRFLEVLSHTDDIKMPPTAKLPDAEIAALTEWVTRGTPFPASGIATGLHSPGSPEGIAELRKSHWSLQPVVIPALPPSTYPDWEQSAIDRWITPQWKSAGIAPSPIADRRTLIRRATYDLLGLP